MIAIIGAYLMYAPKLFKISRKHKLITIGDYLEFRFNNPILNNIAICIGIFVLSSYILTNLKAIGYLIVSISGGTISFFWGIVGASVIMLIYETLGGMRSVAWTDVLQGAILLSGCLVLFVVVFIKYGSFETATNIIQNIKPQVLEAPNINKLLRWASLLILLPFAVSIYPHAVQRIFAARSKDTLKRSLQIMLCIPLITTLLMFIVGMFGIAYFPNLDKLESETIVMRILTDIVQSMPYMQALIILFVCAVIAAIMSTVDSALLSISSTFVRDIAGQFKHRISQKKLVLYGEIVSCCIMCLLIYLAIYLPKTIWKLIEIKTEVLLQLVPAIFLGINIKSISSNAILYGIIAGLTSVLLLHIFNVKFAIHNGVIAFFVNLFIIFVVHLKNREVVCEKHS